MAPSIPKRPENALQDLAAPRDLVEWVRKLPPEGAARRAWVDVARPEWVPYLAALRGLSAEAILRAACECAVEIATAANVEVSPEGARVVAALRAGAEQGSSALATTDAELADLRLKINDPVPGAEPAWVVWARLVLELTRGAGRGNRLIGIALAMKMLGSPRPGVRASPTDLAARLRDKLTIGGSPATEA